MIMTKVLEKRNKKRVLKPVMWLFVEGETEQGYLEDLGRFLRRNWKVKKKGCKAAIDGFSNECLARGIEKEDKKFFIYDSDNFKKDWDNEIQKLINAQLVLTNPCVELWFILHFTEHSAHISTREAERKLKKYVPNYVKGKRMDYSCFIDNTDAAIERNKKLRSKHDRDGKKPEESNPYSSICILIE